MRLELTFMDPATWDGIPSEQAAELLSANLELSQNAWATYELIRDVDLEVIILFDFLFILIRKEGNILKWLPQL